MKEIVKEIIDVSSDLSDAIALDRGTQVKRYTDQLIALTKALEALNK